MSCEACGGDGQIEVGAYRGDDSPETRECRLCGGPKLVINIPAGTSIDHTVEVFKQLGQAAAKTGTSFVASREADMQRRRAMQTAKQVAKERLEQLRQENERRQREAESRSRSADETMNDFLRTRLKS